MNTHDTVVQVRGVLQCAKTQHRTHTRDTCFGITAGLPVPVQNPRDSLVGRGQEISFRS